MDFPINTAIRMPSSSKAGARKATVVIPNWNGIQWLDGCLSALARQDTTVFAAIVVDNGSTDGSAAFIEQHYPDVEVIRLASNTGFANAANIGITKAATPYVVLLNADTEAFPDFLSSLIERIEAAPPEVAAINPQMLRLDDPGRIDDAGDELSWYGAATKRGHNEPAAAYAQEREVFSPCAGASLYRRDFLLALGGFDAVFFAYLEDVDLGLRGRLLGYRYLYSPEAKVLHKSHGADLALERYVELMTRNRLLLFAKNVPARLLIRHAPKLIYGQVYFLFAYARPWSSLKGYWSFVRRLPDTLRKRRTVLRNTRVGLTAWDAWLGNDRPNPSLVALTKARLLRLMNSKVRFGNLA